MRNERAGLVSFKVISYGAAPSSAVQHIVAMYNFKYITGFLHTIWGKYWGGRSPADQLLGGTLSPTSHPGFTPMHTTRVSQQFVVCVSTWLAHKPIAEKKDIRLPLAVTCYKLVYCSSHQSSVRNYDVGSTQNIHYIAVFGILAGRGGVEADPQAIFIEIASGGW